MAVEFDCNFDLKECIRTLGLEEKGRVQQVVAHEVLELSDVYVPFDQGVLRDSGKVDDNGTDVVWNTPYAQYMWNGIVYEDPELHCAGFETEDGWRSRKYVKKVPTERSLQYHNGNLRSAEWVEKMLQNGGREKIEQKVRKAVKH